MKEELLDNTKLAAYFLWEYTHMDNTLQLWYCAEDIACFLEQSDIICMGKIDLILGLGIYDLGYIHFVRHIAYRIYVYTGNNNALSNWFIAEQLLGNFEWRQALISMASAYNTQKTITNGLSCVHSGQIKNFYEINCQVTDNSMPEA